MLGPLDGRWVLSVAEWSSVPEQEANAHLIAAAPELYEVLRCYSEVHGLLTNDDRQALLKVLAKARGEI
jgi:hypothetical protein